MSHTAASRHITRDFLAWVWLVLIALFIVSNVQNMTPIGESSDYLVRFRSPLIKFMKSILPDYAGDLRDLILITFLFAPFTFSALYAIFIGKESRYRNISLYTGVLAIIAYSMIYLLVLGGGDMKPSWYIFAILPGGSALIFIIFSFLSRILSRNGSVFLLFISVSVIWILLILLAMSVASIFFPAPTGDLGIQDQLVLITVLIVFIILAASPILNYRRVIHAAGLAAFIIFASYAFDLIAGF